MALELGAIFDWDGVVIDSHDQHEKAWFRLAAELGKPFTSEMFVETFGMRNETILPEFLKWAEPGDDARIRELGDYKEELYREVLRETGIEPLPGVVELLQQLQGEGIPAAVGSSTSRKNIDTIIEIAGLEGRFAEISAAEDVTQGKPAPDVFLTAAKKIGREPAACVVFEDAHVGIEAGLRAGMRVVGLATTHPIESLNDAHMAVNSLEGFGVTELRALFG
ncbi:MAG: HAD family phosphatase [Planctomycetota bacterium]